MKIMYFPDRGCVRPLRDLYGYGTEANVAAMVHRVHSHGHVARLWGRVWGHTWSLHVAIGRRLGCSCGRLKLFSAAYVKCRPQIGAPLTRRTLLCTRCRRIGDTSPVGYILHAWQFCWELSDRIQWQLTTREVSERVEREFVSNQCLQCMLEWLFGRWVS